jgi:hypothetical protein
MTCLKRVLEHTTPDIVLIQDGAKDHTSAETQAFFAQQTARLQIFQLPTSSPDDNPLEKLWQKIKQPDTQVHDFPTIEALTEKVEQALHKFATAPVCHCTGSSTRALSPPDRIGQGGFSALSQTIFFLNAIESMRGAVACPMRGTRSQRVHNGFCRNPWDVPLGTLAGIISGACAPLLL